MAEPCPLNINTAVALFCSILYLATNVLAFAVAISPYNQGASKLCLVLDVLGNQLFVLQTESVPVVIEVAIQDGSSYVLDCDLDRSIK